MLGTGDLQVNRTSSLLSGMPVWQERQSRNRQQHLGVVRALIEEAEGWDRTANPTETEAPAQARGSAMEVPSSLSSGLPQCPASY